MKSYKIKKYCIPCNEKTRGDIEDKSSEEIDKRLTTDEFLDFVMHQPNTRSSNNTEHNSKGAVQTTEKRSEKCHREP